MIKTNEFIGASAPDALDGLERRIQVMLAGRIRHFELQNHPGGIVLRGRTNTYHAKQLAQHTVMAESEMPILANEIEVV